MKVSDEIFEKMWNAFRCYVGNHKESLDASLAVLPEMYTVEQIITNLHREFQASTTWTNDRIAKFTLTFRERLTQKTPAAQPVGAEVNGNLLYDSAQTPIPATTSFPDVKKEDKDFNVTQDTQDVEPQELCGKPLGAMIPPLLCNRLKGHTGGCYITSKITVPAEPTITLEEHKAKMREAIEFCAEKWAPEGWIAHFKNLALREFSLTEPTPAERVTVKIGAGSQFYSLYYIDDQIVSDEQIKAALIEQLEKKSHDS